MSRVQIVTTTYEHMCDECGAMVRSGDYRQPEGWRRRFVRTGCEDTCVACLAKLEESR